MDKNSKILQRKLREQPQQFSIKNPPVLEEKHVEEEDFEKWRVINMQYRALFKKKDEISFDQPPALPILPQENKPQAKPIRTADNKVDQRYLTNKLLEIEKKQNQKIKRPALLIQSTDELLRQLPKGESLLEEAEIAVSKVLKKNENPETLLRETVENLHLKQIQRIEAGYVETYNDLLKQIQETEQKNIELEQKIRKYSMQANTEDEEIEEIRKNAEKIRDLEAIKEESYREKVLMEETITLLEKDLNETITKHSNEKEKLENEILVYKEKVTQLNNKKVGNLEYECKELQRENLEIEQDIEKIEKLWKGDVNDIKKILDELDENSLMIKKELRDITLSRSVVLQERENIKKKSQDLDALRITLLKTPQAPAEKNPRNLYIYLDNVLTEAARKIRLVLQGKGGITETENVVTKQMESQFFDSENLNEVNPKIKSLRDTLGHLKDKHDSEAVFFEKEKVSEIPKLIQNFKGLEVKALKSSVSCISTLSPIRKISPARESSLSSLSKIRTLTDKIINPKHKRTPSSSSRGSVDLSEVENRKTEHKRYLKSLQKPK